MFLHLFSCLVCSCPRIFSVLVPPFTTCLSYAGSYNYKWHDNCSTNLLYGRWTIFISFIWLINTYFYLWRSVSPMKKLFVSYVLFFFPSFLFSFFLSLLFLSFFISFLLSFLINLFIYLLFIYWFVSISLSFSLSISFVRSFVRWSVRSFDPQFGNNHICLAWCRIT